MPYKCFFFFYICQNRPDDAAVTNNPHRGKFLTHTTCSSQDGQELCWCHSPLGTQANGDAIISHIAGYNGKGKECSGKSCICN